MYTVQIKLNTADNARKSVSIFSSFPIDVYARREHILPDAKSLISMLAVLHISGLELDIHGEEAGALVNMLEQEGVVKQVMKIKKNDILDKVGASGIMN